MTVKLAGTISINRWTANTEPHEGIRIELNDSISGLRMFSLDMTVENFGQAITGLSSRDCLFMIGSVDSAGMKREIKQDQVWVPNEMAEKKLHLVHKDLLSEHEVDGWKIHNFGDLVNPHRRVRDSNLEWVFRGALTDGHYQLCTFIRFVHEVPGAAKEIVGVLDTGEADGQD